MDSTSGFSSVTSSLIDGRPDKDTAGPILIQGFLQYLCQGVIISQSVKFYHRWQDDPVALRVYVGVLLLFSLLQTVLESYKTWVETIVGRHWWTSRLHSTEFLCNALICSICEAFLIRRCYKITQRNRFVLIYLFVLLVVSVVASICLTVRIAQVIGPSSQYGMADPLHASMFAYPLWVFVKLIMALSLTIILSVSLWRTRTGLRHLDRTLNHIIFITFESAALPTACMLVSAAIYIVREMRASSYAAPAPAPASSATAAAEKAKGLGSQTLHLDLFFAILTGKVYTLGLLRTLNFRTQFRAGMHTDDLGRRSLTGWDRPPADLQAAVAGGAQTQGSGGGHGGREEAGYRTSEETVVSTRMDCARVSLQSIPSAHYTTPKARKSSSRDSCRTPEPAGTRHTLY